MIKRKAPERFSARFASNLALPGLVIALIGAGFSTPAEARHHHHHGHAAHHGRVSFHSRHGVRHFHAAVGVGGTAAIVVDGPSGRVIYGMNEDAPRHPASVTKVMTLYLLFEQLEKGKLSLDDEIPVSAHAAAQAPSKLGLRPGQSIRVEDAIKAIVTKSANDIAVAVAEAVGGTESDFAELMTQKAHALGMTRTLYRNASGLPNDEQITTAADLAVLGRTIQAHFPRYYRYFSLHQFAYHGQYIHNHNHLMDRVEGMDGIKTGYTVASGFNLLTSVKRDGHYIVAVVMGGKSARSRDNYMESLIEQHIEEAGGQHAGARVAEQEETAPANGQAAREDEARSVKAEPAKAEAQKKIAPRLSAASPFAGSPNPTSERAEADAPQLHVAAVIPEARPRPAYISAASQASRENDEAEAAAEAATAPIPRHHVTTDGSTAHQARDNGSAVTPGAMRWTTGPAAKDLRAAIHFQPAGKAEAKSEARVETKAKAEAKAETKAEIKSASGVSVQDRQVAGSKPPVSGWMIQIGATDDADKAAALLSRAKSQRAALLSSARPYTEIVRKGHETLYRARFAGLEESKAEAACRALKNSGFSCFTTRN